MSRDTTFLKGVIEGFYGRPWSLETRMSYADHLKVLGLNTYIYCPKADPFLRKLWYRHWPREEWQQLLRISAHYREKSLYWGIGLSPFELYKNYDRLQRDRLRQKIERLQELQPALIAILFDDMPGDLDSLASRQAEIITDVRCWAPSVRIFACPTYYSLDPVLGKYFGRMPEGYWEQLGRDLPLDVSVFWTGNEVCSAAISVVDTALIREELKRPLALWDNYPVNDGAVRSNFLYCQQLAQREQGLKEVLAGHFCNPMNQGLLSLPALFGLAELYAEDIPLDAQYLSVALGGEAWRQLQLNEEEFRTLGLSGMGRQRCLELALVYEGLPGQAATEVADWLRGEYTFDPDCLTG